MRVDWSRGRAGWLAGCGRDGDEDGDEDEDGTVKASGKQWHW